jgi:hypothetical protein
MQEKQHERSGNAKRATQEEWWQCKKNNIAKTTT